MLKDFFLPKTIEEALSLKEKYPRYRFIAGGTEVNARGYNKNKDADEGLISLSKVNLSHVLPEDGNLIIYPSITLQEIIDKSDVFKEPFDVIRTACTNVSNRHVRNMATAGGNIAACKSCSDLLPILLVMDAKLEIYTGPENRQEISLSDYIKKNDRPLITKIIVPGRKNFYISICRYTRTSNDLALINIALGLELEGGICKDARFAIGGVAATPVRLVEAENVLRDEKIDGKLLYMSNKLREEVEKHINPIDDLRGKAWFKKELAGGLSVEALYKSAKKGGIEL